MTVLDVVATLVAGMASSRGHPFADTVILFKLAPRLLDVFVVGLLGGFFLSQGRSPLRVAWLAHAARLDPRLNEDYVAAICRLPSYGLNGPMPLCAYKLKHRCYNRVLNTIEPGDQIMGCNPYLPPL
jgi:hypothetical protein